MGGAASMIYSGAVGEVGGMMVSSTVSSITSGFEMQEGLDVTLYSLQQEVTKFQCAIEAARGRRITNNNQKLLEWLAQIIYAAYLGNYYLRTFKNQTFHPPMIASSQGMSNLLCNYPTNRATKRQRTMIRTFLFGNDEHREVQDVLKMLRSFDMGSFLLMVNAQPERPMKRYLYMEPTRLINRDKEREQVMKFLFEPNMAGENNVDILPIAGSNGVGKTTLALHCFYDPKVQTHFPLKIYISRLDLIFYDTNNAPGPQFIFGYILNQLNCTDRRNFDENTLLAMLKQNLSSEKFLIVIDGVWGLPDSMGWKALLGCLRSCGKQGSKIIFTCDNLIVYNKFKNYETWKPILLDSFPEDEYMLFFMEHAFGSADPEDFPDLANLGGEIAKNLDGSIWGAKILGELLRDNLNAPFWSIFSQVGFLRPKFHGNKNIWPVMKTISQLLPKRLCLTKMSTAIGNEQWVLATCNRFKSFRELMVLGPKYCTPITKQGKNDELEFLVTKHFDLHKSYAFFAVCKEPPIGGFDGQ